MAVVFVVVGLPLDLAHAAEGLNADECYRRLTLWRMVAVVDLNLPGAEGQLRVVDLTRSPLPLVTSSGRRRSRGWA